MRKRLTRRHERESVVRSDRRQNDTATPRARPAFDFSAVDAPAEAGVPGPFPEAVNDIFTRAFGRALSEVDLTHGSVSWLDSLDAPAATIGSHIYLSDEVPIDVEDPFAVDVLTHELSHALAPAAAPTTFVDDPYRDRGERAARHAGQVMSRHVAGGSRGPLPSLAPAYGGSAVVQRWGSGEHRDAVDMSVQELMPTAPVDKLLNPKNLITLGNGVKVTPGQITALMGDFYGHFDKDDQGREQFNPQKSFEQLWNAPPEEMEKLITLVNKDAEAARARSQGKEVEGVDEEEWESVTAKRPTSQKSYLELASLNNSHFSGATMEGVDNNMGVYSIFHQMALAEGAKGTGADENMMRALESSAMHYLTDRHASGHSFDKAGVQDAGGGGTGGNLAAKIVHDRFNRDGVDVTNDLGDTWTAYGDGHWNDDANADNRLRTAQSIQASWAELAEVHGGAGRSADEIAAAGYAAQGTVPTFSAARQRAAEREAGDVGLLDKAELMWEEKSLAVPMAKRGAQRAVDWAEEKVDGAWDWANENVITPVGDRRDDVLVGPVPRGVNALADGARDAWNYIDENTTTDPDEIDWGRTIRPWQW